MTGLMYIVYIILCYTPDKDLLDKNLSLLKDEDVIVINNNPNEKIELSVQVIETGKNAGYAGGMNIGMKQAWEQGADWVVLLNDDVALTALGIEQVKKQLENLPPGIYGPETGSLDNKRWTTILPAKDSKTLYVSGSVMCIHKEVDLHLQGFFEPYFMYYEDVDYCIRAKRYGFEVKHISIAFTHKQSPSLFKQSSRYPYYLARNHLWFVWRLSPLHVKLYELIRLPKTIYQYYLLDRTKREDYK